MRKKGKTLKRIISFALTFVVGLTTLMSAIPESTITAKAASVYVHKSTANTNFWKFTNLGLPNDISAFCIQHGRASNTGETYTASTTATVLSNEALRKSVALAQYYGYPNTSTHDQYFDATQALIWDFIEGNRTTDGAVSLVGTSYRSRLTTNEKTIYDYLITSIRNHYKVPSFDGKTLTLKYNSSTKDYRATITDTNGFIANTNYATALSNAGYTVTRSGNTLTISTKTASTTSQKVNFRKNFTRSATYGYFYEFRNSSNPNGQALTSSASADPAEFSLSLVTEATGTITATKKFYNAEGTEITGTAASTLRGKVGFKAYSVDSNGNESYIALTKTSDGTYTFNGYAASISAATEMTPRTDSGNFSIRNIPAGTYYLTETTTASGYQKAKDAKVVVKSTNTISDPARATIYNNEMAKTYEIWLEKMWQDTEGNEYNYSDMVDKFGKEYVDNLYKGIGFVGYIYVGGQKWYFSQMVPTTYGNYQVLSYNQTNGTMSRYYHPSSSINVECFSTDINKAQLFQFGVNTVTNDNKEVTKAIRITHLYDRLSEFPTVNYYDGKIYFEEYRFDETSFAQYAYNGLYTGTAAQVASVNLARRWSPNSSGTTRPEISVALGDRLYAYNYEKSVTLNVTKRDSETNAYVADAEYTLYLNGKAVESKRTNANGRITFTGLVADQAYTLKETEAPKNYMLDTTTYNIAAKNLSSVTFTTATLTTNQSVSETPKKGRINILKQDDFGNVVGGIQFAVTADKDIAYNGTNYTAGTVIATLTTDASGKASITGLPLDVTYTVSEVSETAPYIVTDNSQSTLIEDDVAATVQYVDRSLVFTNETQTVRVTVHKLGEDNEPLSGAEFTIKAAEDYYVNGFKVHSKGDTICNLTTDDDGIASNYTEDGAGFTFYPMYVGAKYTVTETKPPYGYLLAPEADRTQTLTAAHDTTIDQFYVTKDLYFNDEKQTGTVTAYKYDSNGNTPLSGAEFKLYAGEDISKADGTVLYAKDTVIETAVTGADGKAEFTTDLPVDAKYYVLETKAPKNYKISENNSQSFALSYDASVEHVEKELSFYNDEQFANVTVYKLDKDTKVGLSGAKFEVRAAEDIIGADGAVRYANGALIDTLTTDTFGKATSVKFPLGKYRITEITAPVNFNKSAEASQNITAVFNADVDTVEETVTFENDYQLGTVSIIKYDSTNNAKIGNAVFGLYADEDILKADGTVLYAKDAKIDTLTTNANGEAVSKAVPVGYAYYLKEISVPAPYIPSSDKISVSIDYDSTKTSVEVLKEIPNTPQSGTITVYKRDKKSNRPLSGAVFSLKATENVYDTDGTLLYSANAEIERKTTGADGKAEFRSVPVNYTYTVTEEQAPVNYVNKHETKTFTLSYNAELEFVAVEDDITNDYQQGRITVFKYDRELGNVGLSGAEFTLTANADVYDTDGTTLLYSANSIIQTVTTGADGSAEFNEVPVGYSYKVTETKAPYGYINAHDEQSFDLLYDAALEFVAVKREYLNDYQQGYITVTKKDGKYDDLLSGAVFSIMTTEDVKRADGSIKTVVNLKGETVELYKDTVIDTVTTNDRGIAAFTTMLPVGYRYKIVEVKAPDGYINSNQDYTFDLTYDATIEYVPVTTTINNTPIEVEISKRDAEGNELKDATMQLFDAEGNKIDEWISDGTNHLVSKLKAGTYTLHEYAAPKGYTLATDIIFNVDDKNVVTIGGTTVTAISDDDIPLIVMVDGATKVSVSKQDADGNELEGATMQIIDNKNGEVIRQWISDGTNKLITNLEVGTYTLHEYAAPKGYCIATDISFSIDENNNVKVNGTTVTATANDGSPLIVMVDKATMVEFHKEDGENNNVVGAKLRIVDSEGNVVKEWTSEEEPLVLKAELEAGLTYDLVETESAKGYCLSGKVSFTVSSEGILDTVTMIDKPTIVEISKVDLTGENEVEGALMQVLDEDGNIVAEWTSTKVPYVLRAQLEAGKKYTIHEVTPPKGWVLAADKDFVVNADGTKNIETMNDDETKVLITKRDLTNGDELEGAHLQVLDEDGNVVDEWVSEKEGHLIRGKLKAGGTYTLRETQSADGYTIAEDVTFTVSTDGHVDEVEMWDDVQRGNIEVHKRTEGNFNVKGITFILSGVSDNGQEVERTAVTDKDGNAVFTLIPVGTYTIKEDGENVPYAYLVADEQSVDVLYAQTTTVDFFNEEKTGTIEVHKRTEGDLNLEGIAFILTGTSDSGREISMTATTDKDGKAVFANVPIGTYAITEDGKTVPSAYLVADKQSVEVVYAETTAIEVFNTEKTGSIKVHKRTENMTDISGIEFILTGTSDSGREIRLTATTDKDGIAVFENVPIGTYVITENGETVPSGYLVADKQGATVMYAEETDVTFVNQPVEEHQTETPRTPSNAVTGESRTSPLALIVLILPIAALMVIRKKEDR